MLFLLVSAVLAGRPLMLREAISLVLSFLVEISQLYHAVEDVATLVLPDKANQHLQQLMDRNSEGLLSDQERTGLAALVELSERLSLVRGEALYLLGRKPWSRQFVVDTLTATESAWSVRYSEIH